VNFKYPVFLDLRGKRCLVVGEGHETAAKVQGLVDAYAEVVYVNDFADSRIQALAESGTVRWERRQFRLEDLNSCFLVISDQKDNSAIFRLCEEHGILCNSVDDPEHCRFSFGSVHRQGDLTIAISTNGWAPAIAVRLKEKLQRDVGPEYAIFLTLLKAVRPQIGSAIRDFSRRRELWYKIVDSKALDLISAGREDEAEQLVESLISEALEHESN
jgi:siroheme synthase-like protein